MSDIAVNTRRAKRLLLWYPKAWRERYGDEFTDHLEQEFNDRSINLRRTIDVAYKGVVARVGDFGFSNAAFNAESQTRAAGATSFALTAFVAIIMLNFWSLAMIHWSGRTYHPIPVSATTAILTVIAFFTLVVLVVMVLTVAVSTVRQIWRGRARPLVVPAILAACSGAFLLYAIRRTPYELYLYVHGDHGRPGIGLTHPGPALAAIAETINGMTANWVSLWNQPSGDPHAIYVINGFVPFAVLLVGFSIASLWRRVELPRLSERLSSIAATLLGLFVGVFMVTYVAWLIFGGPSGSHPFPEGIRADGIYIFALALVASLIGRTRWVARFRRRSSTLVPTSQ